MIKKKKERQTMSAFSFNISAFFLLAMSTAGLFSVLVKNTFSFSTECLHLTSVVVVVVWIMGQGFCMTGFQMMMFLFLV